jgi:asparagine synthase (glutamine-hydrolysing)
MAARGPDGEGYYFDDSGRLGLGHRRLAILDPTPAGRQPMPYADGRYWLTYNGEIYNFIELREELQALGHRFVSDSDSEVVLAAFTQWGEGCQLRFNGMWAFAIWDGEDRSLFVSRDRFGIKPLMFAATSSAFAFASEAKAFMRLEGFAATIDDPTSAEETTELEPTSIKNVYSLKPGCCLRIGRPDAEPVARRWWYTYEHLVDVPRSYADQVEEFRRLLTDACRLRMRSDVPIASALSGGLDSTSVLCTLAHLEKDGSGAELVRRPRDWQRAFFVDAPGSVHSAADRPYAELAISSSGCRPRRLNLWDEPIADDIERYLLQTEGGGQLSGYWSWALYRKMKQDGISVTLDGQGADEILGGYHWHVLHALLDRGMRAYLRPLKTLDALGIIHGMQSGAEGRSFSYAEVLALGLLALNPVTKRIPAVRLALDQHVRREGFAGPGAEETRALARLGPLGRELYRSTCHRDLPPLLWFYDIISMSHGVEIRMPFMDWRVVCFSLSLPDESRQRNFTKRILRDAMVGRIPEPVRLRKDKIGFARPIGDILRGPLRDWVRAEVNKPSFAAYPQWNGKAIRHLVSAEGPQHAWTDNMIWDAVRRHWMLESWPSQAGEHCPA